MKFLILFILFFSYSAWADTVRLYDVTNFSATATSGNTYSLNVDKPSGDA